MNWSAICSRRCRRRHCQQSTESKATQAKKSSLVWCTTWPFVTTGSQPIGPQEWERNHALTRADLSFVILGTGSGGTEEVLAYVICAVPKDAWKARGRRFGGIEVIGVHPRVRGLGLASALLVHAMHALRREGLDSAVLHVDQDSRTGAVSLYGRLGFATVRRSVTLAKEF